MNAHPKIDANADSWTVAGRTFTSRLIVGTGKYKSFEQNAAAVEASGAEIVTVAVRRVNVSDPNQPLLTDFIDPKRYTYLPNTAGCFTAEDAIRTLRLAREAGGWELVKLEVLGEAKTLYPDMRETLKATEVLVDAGVGTASDAAVAMELGCDGVLMNTAIAEAKDPIRMARAMKLAVEAGREAYRAGRMPTRKYADPSSPLAGLI